MNTYSQEWFALQGADTGKLNYPGYQPGIKQVQAPVSLNLETENPSRTKASSYYYLLTGKESGHNIETKNKQKKTIRSVYSK